MYNVFFFWIIKASDGKSKIHLKCGDTDEVRPSDFTRFSTQKQLFTPYVVELQSTTYSNLPNGHQDQNRPVVIDYGINNIVEELTNHNYNNDAPFFNKNNPSNYNDNNSRPDEAEYNDIKHKEVESNSGFISSPPSFITHPTRPITNTFNLLNRKTKKPDSNLSGNFIIFGCNF